MIQINYSLSIHDIDQVNHIHDALMQVNHIVNHQGWLM